MTRSFANTGSSRLTKLAASSLLALSGLAATTVALADTAPTVVYSFAGGAIGSQPSSGLVQTSDGYLYGTTYYGADDANGNSWGEVYRVKPDGSGFKVIYTFTGLADGGNPSATLLLGQDGALYGSTTNAYGTGALYGTIFRLTTAGKLTTLHTFTNADGSYPSSPLVQDGTGLLYGEAASGGGGGRGTVFSMKTDGSLYTVLHQFSGDASGGAPLGTTLGTDGAIYGVTAGGGNTGDGVIFTVGKDGNGFKVLHSFNVSLGEGGNPHAPLAQRPSDGLFFGTTNGGGAGGYGVVYSITSSGTYTTVLSLDNIVTGAYPTSPVTFGANGDTYGTTTGGGPDGFDGTFFEISAAGKLDGVLNLPPTGNQAQFGLTIGADGNFYTASAAGGTSGNGSVLEAGQVFPAPVAALPTEQIYFQPLSNPPMNAPVTTVGKPIKILWQSQYANYCKASGSWSGILKNTGSKLVKQETTGQFPYTLTCYNAAGNSSTTTFLQVNP